MEQPISNNIINQKLEEDISIISKTRSSTEHNGMELVITLVLLYKINNYDDLINILRYAILKTRK